MDIKSSFIVLTTLLSLFGVRAIASENAVTFEDNVKPIFKARCFKCHGEDEHKSGLSLHTYSAVLKGGSGGEVVKPSRANTSTLFLAITHASDDIEYMPPKSDKIPDAEIEIVKQWIMGGLLEKVGGESKGTQRNLSFTGSVGVKPKDPAMPQGLPDPKLPDTKRPFAVTALASSPWAPLVAVAGHERVFLKNTATGEILGVLPFPEGTPFVLRFSRDGALLLAAGGKGGASGKAVLYDVKTGKRLADYGDETDVVLAADLSPDQSLIAIGGPSKTVKVFNTKDGKLLYKITKHTDWITSLEFSPNGAQLATADRNGGIHVWDAKSGGIAFSLSEHKDSIRDMAWRPDGAFLASASEDGQLIIWDMKDGWPANTLSDVHKPKPQGKVYGKLLAGVLALAWTSEGKLISAGRDGAVRLFDSHGNKVAAAESIARLPTKVAASYDGQIIMVGDALGTLKFLGVKKDKLVER